MKLRDEWGKAFSAKGNVILETRLVGFGEDLG
jgi:hypothetical protein